MTNSLETGLEIAVIGMSGKFPGARNLKEFWENLKNGIETISTFSTEELRVCGISEQYLENPNYVKAYGVVTGKAYFDSSFFGYTPRESETMDPLIRLFHECAWEALEDAGYDPISYNESIGIYAGSSDGFGWQVVKTLRNIKTQNEDTGLHITENPLLLSSHISHKLNLRGPSITLFTACSTGLVAVHAACRALLTGECHMALAGAGAVTAAEKGGYFYQEGMIMSPDGHCRPFDVDARGTVYGDGLGIVVLKRLKHALEERDNIRVIIKASAVNNDGTDKSSFTAPGKRRIADVVRTAVKLSRVTPGDVSYIETHGTATPLGDAIETGALKDAFNTDKKEYCAIGSVKSNIGHLDVAAGIAAFIKTVLALVHRLIPASLHFETPNPTIDLINSPFYINAALSSWEGNSPRRAGVCSFGIGGTNAFVLLEEAPAARDVGAGVSLPARSRDYRLILLSARTDSALEQMTRNLAEYLKMNPQLNLADVAYTLQVGKRTFSRRRMLVCSTGQEAVEALLSLAPGKVHTSVLKDRDKKITADTIENLIKAATSTADTPPGEQLKSGLEEIGRAWLNGAAIDWEELYKKDSRYSNPKPYRVPLPTYPFERQYYWINPGYPGLAPGKGSPIWLLVNDEHGLETKIRERLRQNGREVVVVRTSLNSSFTRTRDGEFVIDPSQDTHYDTLFRELEKFEKLSIDNRAADMGVLAPRENKPAGAVVPGKVNTIEEMLYQRPLLSTEYAAPRDEIEQALTRVWQKFFGIREVGIRDDFFELGGDSLKAITVVTDIHKEMNARIPISELFQSTTIDKLAQYIKSEKSGKSATDRYSAIEPVEKKEYYPMSSVQERIYILNQLETNSTGYNTPQIFDLEGQVNRERLEQVFGMLVSRHESLRTCFQLVKGETVQRIDHNPGFKVAYYELAAPGENPGTGREKEIIQEFIKPFDLSRSPLLRVGLIRRTKEKHVLMTDMHHIVSDGSSIGILFREFIALYPGQTLPVPRIQYKDYSHWQNSAKQQETMKQQETYWVKQFAENIPVLNLPADYTRPPVQGFAGNTIIFRIRREETEALKHIALNQDATLFMILLSLYNVLLAKICGQEDIVVGTPIAGRTHADLQPIFGMLVNTLALRNYPSGDKTFKEFLQEVKQNTLSAFENQDYLFEDLVENITLDVHRDISRNPIFDTMFSLMNFQSQYEANLKIDIPGLSLAVREEERGASLFDLSLHAIETEQGLLFNMEFCTKLFKHETILGFADYFKKIVSSLVENPGVKIYQIQMISEVEKQRLIYDFNETDTPYPRHKTIGQLFSEQVSGTPHHVALVFQDKQVTYKELNRRSNQLARLLIGKGMKAENPVGILLDRSLEMIVGILSVLKSGAAYLPIDSQYPPERIRYILEDSNMRVLVTTPELRVKVKAELEESFGQPPRLPLEIIDIEATLASAFDPSPSTCQVSSSNLAYVIYTSGSTGRPKGVIIEHKGIDNLVHFHKDAFKTKDFLRMTQVSSPCFDAMAFEIWPCLLNGSALHIVPNDIRTEPGRLKEWLIAYKITASFQSTAIAVKLLEEEWPETGTALKILWTAGDRLTGYLKHPYPFRLYNLYGPTEDTVWTTWMEVPVNPGIETFPPIGTPISNHRVFILDSYLNLQPIGIAGELCISGIGTARGYLNHPELTAEKFHINMSYMSYTSNIYQSGDLARWLPDGNIEFLGRIDTQVKIRGFRIELGEIESLLLSHSAIEDAVVIDRRDFPGLGDQYLCAYIAASGGSEVLPGSTELKEYLARKLPAYMVPSFFVPMERIPLTLNGKVDKNALPKPVIDAAASYIAPGNRDEESLVEIWAEVLGLEEKVIGIDSDFFQLGGHSLKATLMVGKIRKRFEVDISLSDIFQALTIRKIRTRISQKKRTQKPGQYEPLYPVEKKEYYPLSSMQKRLYILNRYDRQSTVYNMPALLELKNRQGWHKQDIQDIFNRLVRRHESFRTSFETVNEEPVQRIKQGVEIKVEDGKNYQLQIPNKGESFGHQNPGSQELRVKSFIYSFIRPFDLSRAPLLRVGLLELEKEKSIMMVDMHHIITDGMSIEILKKEFMAYGREAGTGTGTDTGSALPVLKIQYKEYSEWQRQRDEKTGAGVKQQAYWLKEFAGEKPVLDLPYDYPRPATQSFEGKTMTFRMEKQLTKALKQQVKEQRVTLYTILLAIMDILLAKLSGQEDIVIGTPVAGRIHPDLEPVIGMFVNTLAIRSCPHGEASFTGFLSRVNKGILAAFENQDYPFETLVEEVTSTRDPGRNPLFDVMFTLDNIGENTDSPGKSGAYTYESAGSRFDMSWQAKESGEEIEIDIEFVTKLFKPETIERFFVYFKKIAATVTNNPGIPISRIEIISVEERKQVLYDFNETTGEYPRDKTLAALFLEQEQRTPYHIAVVGPRQIKNRTYMTHMTYISYREINRQSNRLAQALIEKGASPDTIVAIMLERSIEMIVGILGILKAGAAYMPIDTEYPPERIDFMLKDSGAQVLVVDDTSCASWLSFATKTLLNLSEGHHRNFPASQLPSFPASLPSSLAYIIYTSGSTGKPKGVMVPHGGVVNVVTWFGQRYRLGPGVNLPLISNYTFDPSVDQVFGTLLFGAALHVVTRELLMNMELLRRYIDKNQINVLNFVPLLLNELLAGTRKLKSLRTVISGGERLDDTVKDNIAAGGYDLYNHYGPTETTIDTLSFCCTMEEPVRLGKPIANVKVYILDQYRQPMPVGVTGELVAAGAGVTRGYLNRPELTAARFVISHLPLVIRKPERTVISHLPLVIGSSSKLSTNDQWPMTNDRFYLTGDLARWRWDGNIEFSGRIDHQVKIQGYRVEPGEIENHLLSHKNIKEALVVARRQGTGISLLCAYYVSVHGSSEPVSRLKEFLTGKLPGYMVPSYFVQLEKFPLTPNGKIDRNALPEPQMEAEINDETPGNDIQVKLVELWSDVLEKDKETIGTGTNFFLLGGNSLKATFLAAKIHKEMQVKISLADIFRAPTIKGLAQYIQDTVIQEYTRIQPAEKMEYYPLSSPQIRLYVLQQMEMGGIAYNMPGIIPLAETPAIKKLQETFIRLIERHESLRTSFHLQEKEIIQVIHQGVEFKIESYQVQATGAGDRSRWEEAPIGQINSIGRQIPGTRDPGVESCISSFVRPFDLARAPLLRAGLLQWGPRCFLLLDMHHIISDGISYQILDRDVMALYNQEILPFLRLQYKDFARWQTGEAQKKAISRQENSWLKVFPGEIPLLNLPIDYPRPPVQSFAGDTVDFKADAAHTRVVKSLAAAGDVSLYMLLLAVFNILLYKLTGQEDIIIGTPVAGRRHADIQQIIGMFVNTLAMRNFPTGEKSFPHFLQEVKENTLNAFENQEYPFEELVEKVAVNRDVSRNPLFDAVFAMDTQKSGEKTADPGPSRQYHAEITPDYDNRTAKFDLTLTTVEKEDNLYFYLEYCTKLFKKETIERIVIYFKEILSTLGNNFEIKVGEIGILPEQEKLRLLDDLNRQTGDYPTDRTIPGLFTRQVEQTPAGIAAASGNIQITYKELEKRADELASAVRNRRTDARDNRLVGLMAEKSLGMIVGILGILKAGCGYIPLNPRAPVYRNLYMLNESRVNLLVTTLALSRVSDLKKEVLRLEETGEMPPTSPRPPDPDPGEGTPGSLTWTLPEPAAIAYVMFTSGSTGKPKGVPISYANLSPLLYWGERQLAINSRNRVLQNLSYYFDWSVMEIFITLTTGAALYMAGEDILLDPVECLNFIEINCIDVLYITPSHYRYLAGTGRKTKTLKYLFLGAEELTYELAERALAAVPSHCRVFNMYGPTEATIISAVMEIRRGVSHGNKNSRGVPIGGPISNFSLYVLDRYLNLCPVYLPGELYIGGIGLSAGYLNDPEKTCRVFIPNPYKMRGNIGGPGGASPWPSESPPGGPPEALIAAGNRRLYKTGDRARWQEDGNIQFLGRIDTQVKIRGNRIETGEIENQLLQHEKVKEALVTVNRTGETENDEQYLCAYIVPAGKGNPGTAEMRNHLAKRIPGIMIPAYFIPLDKIPLTANGKVDIKALPSPSAREPGKTKADPGNHQEKKLLDLWAAVLNLTPTQIGIDDNFFEMGGHSLKAAQLMAKIKTRFNTVLSLQEIFKYPTVRQLASRLAISPTVTETMSNVEKQEYYQVSYNQERLWHYQRRSPGSDAYNIAARITLQREIQIEDIRESLSKLMHRHESFRTRFREVRGQPVQIIEPRITVPLELIDLSTLQPGQKELEIEKIYRENCRQPFDLTSAPLFRAVLLNLGAGQGEFIYVMHHIISDGWSQEQLNKEFPVLYNQQTAAGEGITLSPLRYRYRDYAHWQRRLANDAAAREEVLNHWRSEFEKGFPPLRLPRDRNGDPEDHRGITFRGVVPPGMTKSLRQMAKVHETSLFMIMFSAFNRYLSTLTGRPEIVSRVPAAGRDRPEVQDIMGYLVNPVIIKNRVEKNEPFTNLLHRVTENTLAAFRHQWYPFEKVLADLDRENPGTDVSFNMLSMQEGLAEIDLDRWDSFFTGETAEVKIPLTLRILLYRNGIEIFWNGQKSLIKPDTLEKMARDYLRELEGIIAAV